MSDHHSDRLDGWKAIADFLARDQRTVQRWAKTRGLPIHHLHGGKGGSVFAVRRELDEWLVGTRPSLPIPPTAPGPIQEPPAEVPPRGKILLPEFRRMRLTAGIPVVILAAALALAWIAVNQSDVAVPDTIQVLGNALVAKADGQVLWRYPLDRPGDAPSEATWRSSSLPVRLIDLNADGAPEIPVLLALQAGDERFVRNDLFSFSVKGKLLWRYTPQASFRFGNEMFDGPWRIQDWIATENSSGIHVWVSVIHHVWWPSFVMAIDAEGQATTRFVHPGHVYSLTEVKNDTGSYVVAAGINNEYGTAMLAVLDSQGPTAEAPSSDSRYSREGGPRAKPARYLLFPRSELNSLLGQPYNRVYETTVVNNRVELFIQEASQPHLRAIYRLSPMFVPERVGLADAYWEAHRGLEREGRLAHAVKDCPDRDGMKVRMWEPEEGWSERMVPVSLGQ